MRPYYRFTFLATLFVILIISTALVLRTYVERRRFRNGEEIILLTHLGTLETRVHYLRVPRLHEVWPFYGVAGWLDLRVSGVGLHFLLLLYEMRTSSF